MDLIQQLLKQKGGGARTLISGSSGLGFGLGANQG